MNLLLIYFFLNYWCSDFFPTRPLFAANHGAGFVNATLGARADRKQASVFLEESVVVFLCRGNGGDEVAAVRGQGASWHRCVEEGILQSAVGSRRSVYVKPPCTE